MFVLNGWMTAVPSGERTTSPVVSGRETAEAFLSRPFVLPLLFPPTFFFFLVLSVVVVGFFFFAVLRYRAGAGKGDRGKSERGTAPRSEGGPRPAVLLHLRAEVRRVLPATGARLDGARKDQQTDVGIGERSVPTFATTALVCVCPLHAAMMTHVPVVFTRAQFGGMFRECCRHLAHDNQQWRALEHGSSAVEVGQPMDRPSEDAWKV